MPKSAYKARFPRLQGPVQRRGPKPPLPFAAILALLLALTGIDRLTAAINLPLDPTLQGYALENAFGELQFDHPIALVTPPGETNRLFVVERGGLIKVIPDLTTPSSSTFLSLKTDLRSTYLESGLLGLAFHPGFETNRFLYIYRTAISSSPGFPNRLHDQVLRFEASASNRNIANPGSLTVILNQYDDNQTHNGGDLKFGPDGYLYISSGDNGPLPIPNPPTLQPIDRGLFGAILRIDVDNKPGSLPPNPHSASTPNYSIPPDNPFIGVTQHQGLPVDPNEVRTELFALGFRNPWRMSFDPVSGRLFCGDVGNDAFEEINIVESGGNYGWPYIDTPGQTTPHYIPPPEFLSDPPLVAYPHGNKATEGNCVIGGVFYYGSNLPNLHGQYIFGDLTRGHIWAIDQTSQENPPLQRLTAEPGITAFVNDPSNQDILVANYHLGTIRRLVYTAPEDEDMFPQKLSDTGAFSDLQSLTPATDVIPYDINLTFWSDDAIKTRWYQMPLDGSQIEFKREANWSFPDGMMWIKHFEMELIQGDPSSRRKLETRFIVKNPKGVYGVTYKWNESETDAILVPEEGLDEPFTIQVDGNIESRVWHYPSRAECLTCHSEVSGQALGFSTEQLNLEINRDGSTVNQLEAMANDGHFTQTLPPTSELRRLVASDDEDHTLYDRVRSYLTANCVHCHQEGGLNYTTVEWDARLFHHIEDTKLLDGRIITPNSTDTSDLLRRISITKSGQMPPIATAIQNTNAMQLVTDWINSFPRAPWSNSDIGSPRREGSSSQLESELHVGGSGRGSVGQHDEFQFLHRSVHGNGMLVARLDSQTSVNINGGAGLMVRASSATNSMFGMVRKAGIGNNQFLSRQTEAGIAQVTDAGQPDAAWLKIIRENNAIIGFTSPDRVSWSLAGYDWIELGEEVQIGLTSHSGDDHSINLAKFKEPAFLSISLELNESESSLIAPGVVSATANVIAEGTSIDKVQFYNGNTFIGETRTNHTIIWTNVPTGSQPLTAYALTTDGDVLTSMELEVPIQNQPSVASAPTLDLLTQGDWNFQYGTQGYLIVNHQTNLSPNISIVSDQVQSDSWANSTTVPPALIKPDAPDRIAARWHGTDSFTVDIDFRLGNLQQIALYFLDWGNFGLAQTVEVIDPESGSILSNQSISNFQNGIYVVWKVRGRVTVRITSDTDQDPVLSGIFIDEASNQSPTVSLSIADVAGTITLPKSLTLTASASDDDGTVESVEFFANGNLVHKSTIEPHQFVWDKAVTGTNRLFARATDNLGATTISETMEVVADSPAAAAAFVRLDNETSGNWVGTYGSEGAIVAADGDSLPEWANYQTDGRVAVWHNSTLDPRGLTKITEPGRIAGTWVDITSFNIDLQLNDGKVHLVSFYLLDWDCDCRRERIEIRDQVTGVLLESGEYDGFGQGTYVTFAVRGAVSIRITRLLGNAVVSGIFIDPSLNPPPTISFTSPSNSEDFTAPTTIPLIAEASDPDGIRQIEYFVDGQKVDASTQPPFEGTWLNPLAGTHTVFARVTDNNGSFSDSENVTVIVDLPPAAALLIDEDLVTQGSWIGTYGATGHSIPVYNDALPPFIDVERVDTRNHVWSTDETDPRAVERFSSDSRIATTWVSTTGFSINITLADGHWHNIGLYFLDWDQRGRVQRIDVFDKDENLLDSHVVSDFENGRYLVWAARGELTFRITAIAANALLNGIYFDQTHPLTIWKMDFFSPEELFDDLITGNSNDPDMDGTSTAFEFVQGTNPTLPDSLPFIRMQRDQGQVQFLYTRSKSTAFIPVVAESSEDLRSWHVNGFRVVRRIDHGATETVILESSSAVLPNEQKFLRFRLDLDE